MPEFMALNEMEDVEVGSDSPLQLASIQLLKQSLPVTEELLRLAVGVSLLHPLSAAALTAFNTVSSLVTLAAPMCTRDRPSKEIDVKVNGNGDMIYRCRHSPAHEWRLSGEQIP